jgi:hypothetical protein
MSLKSDNIETISNSGCDQLQNADTRKIAPIINSGVTGLDGRRQSVEFRGTA